MALNSIFLLQCLLSPPPLQAASSSFSSVFLAYVAWDLFSVGSCWEWPNGPDITLVWIKRGQGINKRYWPSNCLVTSGQSGCSTTCLLCDKVGQYLVFDAIFGCSPELRVFHHCITHTFSVGAFPTDALLSTRASTCRIFPWNLF